MNSAGDVFFKWERSNSTSTATAGINFASGGMQTVTDSWTLGVSGNYSERLHILSPNDVTTNDVTFTLICS